MKFPEFNFAKSRSSRFGIGWAFTLIELLVVIAIIGILAGLLLPVFGRVKRSAKIRTAQGEIKSVAAGILQYNSDYSRYPGVPVNSGDITYGDTVSGSPTNRVYTNSDVIAVLLDQNYGINVNHARNPRKKNFLPIGKTVNDVVSGGVSSVDNQIRDPWGHPYIISMDLDGDGYCTDTFYSQSSVTKPTETNVPPFKGYNNLIDYTRTDVYRLSGQVMVWSLGPDGKADSNTKATVGVNKDNIISW